MLFQRFHSSFISPKNSLLQSEGRKGSLQRIMTNNWRFTFKVPSDQSLLLHPFEMNECLDRKLLLFGTGYLCFVSQIKTVQILYKFKGRVAMSQGKDVHLQLIWNANIHHITHQRSICNQTSNSLMSFVMIYQCKLRLIIVWICSEFLHFESFYLMDERLLFIYSWCRASSLWL